jgi:hypothetical protein
LSTSILIDVLNFLPGNKKATRSTILSSLINRLLCRRSFISAGWRWRRRRWHIPHGVLEVFVFSQRRTRPFPFGVLEVFVFSQRRTRPFPFGVLELWDLSRRRRWRKLHVALELLVSSSRRRLLVAL